MKQHLSAVCVAALALGAAAEPKDIFWIGNSHTRWSAATATTPNGGSVPGVADLVGKLAVAAGYDAPNHYWDVINGEFISNRVGRAASLATNSVPAGVTIDTLVLQGHSTESLTWLGGNAATFGANTAAIESAFRNMNNSALETVLYQTWARERGHGDYQANGGPVPSIQAWHDANRASYTDAGAGINANGGSAEVSRVGDAFALADWDQQYYVGDDNHFSREGGVLASVVLFNSIYNDDVSRLDINLNEFDDEIEITLRQLGVSAAEWEAITALATQAAIPAPGVASVLVLGGALAARRRR
ncbi:MAG: hypothetical protein CMJ31_03440 [Phycisphaerae bacterium]|nr:hypothetical protein [Phycisphaerae bacterium]